MLPRVRAHLFRAVLRHEIEDGDIQFSQAGDSGALVFTEDHVVVGMVIGGSVSANGLKPSPLLFTRIEDLIADIKLITKATDVRLKAGRS
ncbi:unnamed protein product [Penicillium camemberti]|uniref:Str. FM013 n=1 Tax=Penicillium camemberti (strain FM 013) TaxID=1429867 RepID=A0A0G4PKX6_PENC3|nr:unnamed protein product [Penicillium camemberti]